MKLTANEIIKIMKNSDCEYFGIRADKAGFNAGDELKASHQWFQDYQDGWELDWDGDRYDDPNHPYNAYIGCWDDGELSGTCALYVDEDMTETKIEKVLREMRYYLYKDYTCVYLIGGDGMEDGNDIGETIIENARVLALISDEK